MSGNPSSLARDFSIPALSGATQQLFPAVAYNAMEERFIMNSGANDVWVNLFGGVAAVSTAGSFKIPSGGAWSGRTINQVNVIGTAGQPLTAGER